MFLGRPQSVSSRTGRVGRLRCAEFLNPDLPGHDTVLIGLQIGYQHIEFIPRLDPANLLIETRPRVTLAHESIHSRSTPNNGALAIIGDLCSGLPVLPGGA